jgi:hypothetical protein
MKNDHAEAISLRPLPHGLFLGHPETEKDDKRRIYGLFPGDREDDGTNDRTTKNPGKTGHPEGKCEERKTVSGKTFCRSWADSWTDSWTDTKGVF